MRIRLAGVLVFLLLLGAVLIGMGSMPVYASALTQFMPSSGGTTRQYFVPFDDAHLWELFAGKGQCHYQNTWSAPQQPLISYLDLHNPHTFPITVTVSSNMGDFDMMIPPTTTLSVLHETGWTDISTGTSAVHLKSVDSFWGIAVVDSSSRNTGNSRAYD